MGSLHTVVPPHAVNETPSIRDFVQPSSWLEGQILPRPIELYGVNDVTLIDIVGIVLRKWIPLLLAKLHDGCITAI